MLPYTSILFDLGNTLVYRIVTQERTLRILCEENGVEVAPDADFRGAVAVWRACHAAHYLSARTSEAENALALREAGAVLTHLAGARSAERYAEAIAPGLMNVPRWWGVYDDVPHVLDALKARGIRMAVVSEWEPSLGDFCRRMGLSHAFEVVVSSVTEGMVKPSPRLFSLALERLGESPDRALFVGDDYRLDVTGARAAGITPLLIDRNDRFLDTDCHKVRRMDEVLDIVTGCATPRAGADVCISGFAL